MILEKNLKFRKLAWQYLGCSLYDLHDLLKAVYERGIEDGKRLQTETKTTVQSGIVFGEESLD